MCLFSPSERYITVLYYSPKTACLRKIWFFSYGLKCSQSIRLQSSSIINISGTNQLISQFCCMEIPINGRQYLRLLLLVGCDYVCLSSNKIAVYFDQYLQRGSSDILDFLYGDNHQQKVVSVTTTFGWVCLLSNQIAEFMDHQYLWKESIDIFIF